MQLHTDTESVKEMGNKRHAKDHTTLRASELDSDVEAEVDSSAPQPADEVLKSPRPKSPQTTLREKAETDSAPGSEYWLP